MSRRNRSERRVVKKARQGFARMESMLREMTPAERQESRRLLLAELERPGISALDKMLYEGTLQSLEALDRGEGDGVVARAMGVDS